MYRTKRMAGCLVAVAVLAAAFGARGEIVDQILATVDTEVILQSQLMSEIAPALNALRGTLSDEELAGEANRMLREALEQAIDDRILLRQARLADAQIDEKAVEKQLDETRAQFDSEDAFLRALEATGDTVSAFRERLRKRMLAAGMAASRMKRFEKEVVVSEADVAQYYQDHKDEFVYPERVRCRTIYMEAGDDPQERAVVKARLEQLKDEIEAGADFVELANAYGESPYDEEGGLIGWMTRADFNPALENAVFALRDGEVSDVIELPGGFHLILVEQHQEAGLRTLDEVRADIEPKLREQRARQRFDEWMAELRKQSRVQIFL